MVCHQCISNPSHKPMLAHYKLEPYKDNLVKFESKYNDILCENAFENVHKMSAHACGIDYSFF